MGDGPIIQFSPPQITDDDVEAVVRTLRSGWLTSGEECERLEADLEDHLAIPHAVTFSSCTAPLHHFSWFRQHAEVGPGGTPVADELAPRVLSLPLHPSITTEQVDQVCDALATALT